MAEVTDEPALRLDILDLPICSHVGPEVEEIIRQKIPLTVDEELAIAAESLRNHKILQQSKDEALGAQTQMPDTSNKWLRKGKTNAEKYHMMRIAKDSEFQVLCEVAEGRGLGLDEVEKCSISDPTLLERHRKVCRSVRSFLEQMRMTEDAISMERQLRDAAAWLRVQRASFVGKGSELKIQRAVAEFHDFCGDCDITQIPGSARYVPNDRSESQQFREQVDSPAQESGRPPQIPRVQLPPARERLQDFETHRLISRPLTARKLKTISGDSPEPGERPFTPSTATGGYTARSFGSARSTPVPWGSRPNSAISYGRPMTARSGGSGRPESATVGTTPRIGLPQRPRTATGVSPGVQQRVPEISSVQMESVPPPALEITSVHDPPTAAELNMSERWLQNRNREIVDKMVGEEQRTAMQEWAERRARVEEEIMRNTETARFQSELWRRGYSLPHDTHDDIEPSDPTQEVLDNNGRATSRSSRAPPSADVIASGRPRPQSLVIQSDRRSSAQSALEAADDDTRKSHVHFDVKTPSGAPSRSQALNPRIAELRRIHANLIQCTDDVDKYEDDLEDSDSDLCENYYVPLSEVQGASDGATKPDRPRRADDSDVLAALCDGWRHKHGIDGPSEGGSNLTLDAMRRDQKKEVAAIKRALKEKDIVLDAWLLESALVMPVHTIKPMNDVQLALYEVKPNLPTNPHAPVRSTKKKRGAKAVRKSMSAGAKAAAKPTAKATAKPAATPAAAKSPKGERSAAKPSSPKARRSASPKKQK